MGVEVNWIAILLATLSTMVVGAVWYAPPVFGRAWQKLTGRSDKELAANGSWWPIVIAVVISFITAFVLAHVTFLAHNYFGGSWLLSALSTAFWMWLGFVAARILMHDSFEGRPKKLTLLNLTHELVTMLIMGLIIGLFTIA